jgi:hypothetical protein
MGAAFITLDELQAALARCMSCHPPEGAERRLHKDANRLADLFGLMVYERAGSVQREHVAPDILDIYSKWAGPMPDTTKNT